MDLDADGVRSSKCESEEWLEGDALEARLQELGYGGHWVCSIWDHAKISGQLHSHQFKFSSYCYLTQFLKLST